MVFADGDATVGAGHVMRCLALAEAFCRKGYQVNWAARSLAVALRDRVTRLPTVVYDIDEAVDLTETLEQCGSDVLIVDTYKLTASEVSALPVNSTICVAVDDNGLLDSPAFDVIVNPNIDASPNRYRKRRADAKLLCGSAYTMIRQEFLDVAGRTRSMLPPRRVLVTMGGGDALDTGIAAAETVASALPDAEIQLLLGPAASQDVPAFRAANVSAVGATDRMAEVLSETDLVISAAGSTTWEICCLGLPAILVVTANNQAGLAKRLAKEGLALTVDAREEDWPASLQRSLEECLLDPKKELDRAYLRHDLIDGLGADRIVDEIVGVQLEANA